MPGLRRPANDVDGRESAARAARAIDHDWESILTWDWEKSPIRAKRGRGSSRALELYVRPIASSTFHLKPVRAHVVKYWITHRLHLFPLLRYEKELLPEYIQLGR